MTDKELLEKGIYRPLKLDDSAKAYLKLGYKLLIKWRVPTLDTYCPVFFNICYNPLTVSDQHFIVCTDEIYYCDGEKWDVPYFKCNDNKVINIYGNLNTLFNDSGSIT